MPDSTATVGTPVTPAPVGRAADFTSANGNGHSEVVADSGSINQSFVDPTAVVRYTGNGDAGLATGYIQSDTAGRGVIRITTNQAFTYNGTGSTLVGLAGATGADTLLITALSVTMTTGTLTALGAGSTALDVNSTGGAGSGGIDVTVDGDILSSGGPAIILDQNNAAATGNVVLTSTAGNTITSGDGNAATIRTDGSGTITVNLAAAVSATGGHGISVGDSATGGDISVTTAVVSALSVGDDAINVQSPSTTADVTVIANGAIDGGNDGIVALILDPTATGNISVTTNSTVNAGNDGIDALNSGTGSTTVDADGAITAAGGDGILATSSGGAITVTAGNVSASAEQGVDLQQTDASGTGALSVTANGDVSGTDGIRVLNSGTGAVTVEAGGGVTGTASDAILIVSTNAAAGAIGVTTTTGKVLRAGGDEGIDIDQSGTGNVSVDNAAAISSGTAGNTLQDGIDVSSTGTGNITINNSGAIGTAGDRAQVTGISGAINNAASAGTVSVAGTGAIFSVGNGIDVFTSGTGAASVVYSGAIETTTDHGFRVETTSGAITVSNGGAINALAGIGIVTQSTTGNQTVTVGANINSAASDGVHAASTSGTIAVNVNGGNVTAAGDAVDVSSNGAKTVTVAAGRTVSGDFGIFSTGTGATTVNNSGTITGTTTAIRSTTSATTVNNLTGGTINGAFVLSDLIDAVTNAGTINTAGGLLDLRAGDDLYDGRNGSASGTIEGNSGNDTLLGGAGAETMSGGSGVDILEGNGGSDTLTGGAASDTLTGGSGNDSFRDTAAGLNGDTIADLVAGDRIVISNANLAGFSFSLSGSTLTYTGGTLTLTGFSGQLVASAAAGGGVQLTVAANDARNDFNGDGRSDILWRHDSGLLTEWLGTPSGGFIDNGANAANSVSTAWHVDGIGDFNGDGRDDILWRHDQGHLTEWLGTSSGGFTDNGANAFASIQTTWSVVGIGDFNGDGRDDILWRHEQGHLTEWLGTTSGGFIDNGANAFASIQTTWQVDGIGDFNGDGRDDILWRHDQGHLTEWLGTSSGGFIDNGANAFASVSTAWQVQPDHLI